MGVRGHVVLTHMKAVNRTTNYRETIGYTYRYKQFTQRFFS